MEIVCKRGIVLHRGAKAEVFKGLIEHRPRCGTYPLLRQEGIAGSYIRQNRHSIALHTCYTGQEEYTLTAIVENPCVKTGLTKTATEYAAFYEYSDFADLHTPVFVVYNVNTAGIFRRAGVFGIEEESGK